MAECVYLGWGTPFLHSVAGWLLEECGVDLGSGRDLRRTRVLMPGRRYGRKLLGQLATRSSAPVLPPEIVTPGQLAEQLSKSEESLAGPVTSRMAWVNVLAEKRIKDPSPLFLDYEPDDVMLLWSLSERMQELQVKLAAGGYSLEHWREGFTPAARGVIESHSGEPERWDELALLEKRYRELLSEFGLVDSQLSRLDTSRVQPENYPDRLVLAGISTLSRQHRDLILAAEALGLQCTALIFAEDERTGLADPRFDELGCIRETWWKKAHLPIPSGRLQVFKDPVGQAQGVAQHLLELPVGWSTSDVVVGLGDSSLDSCLHASIERLQDASGEPLKARSATSRLLSSTSAFELLRCVGIYGGSFAAADFSALLRHPDLAQIPLDALPVFERYCRRHQPETIGSTWRAIAFADRYVQQSSRRDQAVLIETSRILGELFDICWTSVSRPYIDWLETIGETLQKVYGAGTFSPATGLEELSKGLQNLVEEESTLTNFAVDVSAVHAIAITLDLLGSVPVTVHKGQGGIEILEWLELPLDDAPVVCLTGLNDGMVPASMGVDPYLPNSLRAALGLETDELRLAREKFALAGILNSRQEVGEVWCMAGSTTGTGDPLLPSRLLLSVPLTELPTRVQQVCTESKPAPLAIGGWAKTGETCLPKMTPLPDERLREVLRARTYSITDFGAYLRCPYSFAVERLLGLEMPESGSRELGPADFGNLLHWVLEAFGRDIEARHLNEEEAIAQWLDKALNRFTNARFGAAATLEVQVQLEQIRGRLFSFAHFQSARRQEGWAIVGTEESIKGFLVVSDGSKVRIKGRIDRIDKHEVSGVIAILDYKTSDQPTLAAKKHLDGEEWIDLQLPLCRYLWEQMHPDDQVEIHTGFVHLPQKAGGCKISRLELSDDSLTSAVAKAVSLVESIQALDFKPSDKVFKNSMDRLRGYGFLDLKAALDEGDET